MIRAATRAASGPPAPRRPIGLGGARGGLAFVAVAAAAAAATVALGLDGPAATGGKISWRPTATGIAGAKEVAAHVSAGYRLPGGALVADVWASSTQPLGAVVLFDGRERRVVPVASQVQYTLCGPGGVVGCSLAEKSPWRSCALGIRRQALDLALNTFVSLRDVDVVVVGLPTHQRLAGFAVFERRDFPVPRATSLLRGLRDDSLVNRSTLAHTYALDSIVPEPDGSLTFVLDRVACPLPPSTY